MDYKQKQISETSANPSCLANGQPRILGSDQQFSPFSSCVVRSEQTLPEFTPSQHSHQTGHGQPRDNMKRENHLSSPMTLNSTLLDCDPRAMLNSLSFLEQKVHQVQDIVRSIMNREGRFPIQATELDAQKQLVTADLTSIIIQLISTAGTLLPSVRSTLLSTNSSVGQLPNITGAPSTFSDLNGNMQRSEGILPQGAKNLECEEQLKGTANHVSEVTEPTPDDEHDGKDFEDGGEGENLPPGSYEILQLEKEDILAPHTHFCLICGKGFKRDANLRMHMRGHGDEYKSPSALAKPSKEPNSEPVPIKRYSCPFVGCKRNKDHKKFQPLKTILCVKNHYKRSHCDKSYTCSKCNSKKFSVLADLKTHEKHCGRDKWLCSCGTTFSRKDKLFGHVALFQGHTPALSPEENKGSGTSNQGQSSEAMSSMGSMNMGFNFSGSSADDIDVLDIKGIDDDDAGFFSPMGYDSCNFGGFNVFQHPAFGVHEVSFSFLNSMSSSYVEKTGENPNSN